jgi:hypothetical protein
MTNQLARWVIAAAVVMVAPVTAAGQTTGSLPRTADGKPDLTGVWQAVTTANWNLQAHPADKDVPAGLGVVEGDEIPYQPWAAAKREENFKNRATADSEAKCYLPGVPRINYMPYPFQILQTSQQISILYEYAHAVRRIYMDSPHPEGPIEWYMGDSRARWEGDTLVVDVVHFTDQTWFDRAGNFHSEALHVVERYTPVTPHHISYEVTIEDPKVFTRPWKMSMPLYRRMEKNIRILEYECYTFGFEHTWLKPPEGPAVGEAASGQAQSTGAGGVPTYMPPRTPDGQPDLQGFWLVVPGGTYNIWDLEYQPRFQNGRPDPALRGKSRIVDPPDGKVPYQPWAAEKAKLIHDNHADPTPQFLDPDARCFLQGVPRHLYNRELEIWQPPGRVVIFNMAHHTFRDIPVNSGPHIPGRIKLWMGDSRGRWEGNTLVVDVANNNDQTWFDIVGDFHSDALHVAERFTRISADAIEYRAVITDPKVYTRPWTIALRLERQRDQSVEMWEEACYENNERSLEGMLNRPGR